MPAGVRVTASMKTALSSHTYSSHVPPPAATTTTTVEVEPEHVADELDEGHDAGDGGPIYVDHHHVMGRCLAFEPVFGRTDVHAFGQAAARSFEQSEGRAHADVHQRKKDVHDSAMRNAEAVLAQCTAAHERQHYTAALASAPTRLDGMRRLIKAATAAEAVTKAALQKVLGILEAARVSADRVRVSNHFLCLIVVCVCVIRV